MHQQHQQHRALPWHLKLTWRHYMEALLLVVCAVTLAGVVVSFVSTFQFFREEAPGETETTALSPR
eukprot:2083418-Rhodomonas_salina.2